MLGRPYALMLTAGNVSDVKAAPALLERAGRMRYLLGDKGYNANSLRKTLRENGTSPVIPVGAIASAQFTMISSVTEGATSSRTPSVA